MERLDKACVLIAAYNAEQTLGSVLEKVQHLKIDTIVVNDGSIDKTKRIALEYGVQLLEHPSNLGKGAALRTGFNYILEKDYQVVITLLPGRRIWSNDFPSPILEPPGSQGSGQVLPCGYYR